MNDPLFIESSVALDPLYKKIWDERDSQRVSDIMLFTEVLWEKYSPYADPHFMQEFQNDIHARFWEMYLTCAFLEKSLHVESKAKGPDILIQDETCRVGIEAIVPSGGADVNPDRVPDLEHGVTMKVPDEQIILRYRSAIREKFDNKYPEYLSANDLLSSDPYVIAINSCKIEMAITDNNPPRILSAVFPIGPQQVTLNIESGNIADSGFKLRLAIHRRSGVEIPTDLFTNTDYENLSGIIFSRASVNRPIKPLGADFLFINNPLAKNPVPPGLFKLGREYTAHKASDGYDITSREWNSGNTILSF